MGFAARKDLVRLCFVGDVAITHATVAAPDEVPARLAAFKDLFAAHDLVLGNLEFSTVPDATWDHGRAAKMSVPVSRVRGLRAAGFTAFSLANNHVMDFGEEGLRSICAELDSQSVRWSGAGMTVEDARRPAVLTLGGRRVTVIGACDCSKHYATRDNPGIAPLDGRVLRRQVRAARETSDIVMVVLHADLEFTDYPAPWRVRLSRHLVEDGAHLVVQHHPHVVQGYEFHRDGLIAYSLGNFVFRVSGNSYQETRSGTRDGVILSVSVDFSGPRPLLKPAFLPVHIDDAHFPTLLEGERRDAALARIETLAQGLKQPSTVRSAWRRRAGQEMYALAYGVYAAIARGNYRRALRAPWYALRTPEDCRWLVGWLTGGFR